MEDLDRAKRKVMMASLHCVYAEEVYGGRLSATESALLDHAQDMLNKALKAYVELMTNARR